MQVHLTLSFQGPCRQPMVWQAATKVSIEKVTTEKADIIATKQDECNSIRNEEEKYMAAKEKLATRDATIAALQKMLNAIIASQNPVIASSDSALTNVQNQVKGSKPVLRSTS